MALTDADIKLAVRTAMNDNITPYKTSDAQIQYWIAAACSSIAGICPCAVVGDTGGATPVTSAGIKDGLYAAIIEFCMAMNTARTGDKTASVSHMNNFSALVGLYLKNP